MKVFRGLRLWFERCSLMQGDIIPLLCSHNTVRLRFDIERADYTMLYNDDPTVSRDFFAGMVRLLLSLRMLNRVKAELCS